MLSTEKVEQFMEVARQIENDEALLSHSRSEREGSRESDRDDDRERIRKGSSYERERKESSRYTPYPSSKSDRDRAKKRESRKENRVYVSNLPFSLKWQELKDRMKKVGDVSFVEILEDSSGRSKGCGVVEFTCPEDAEKAIRELNDTDLGGRMLKVREDRVESDDRPRRSREKSSSSGSASNILGGLGGLGGLAGYGMMGLGQFGLLQQMSNRSSDTSACSVFVSNLDYRVTWAKLKDTFKAAGKVIRADISEGSDGKSKGHGTVQFETPLEAVNAVCVMNGKSLFDRTMNVRLDRESPYFNMFGGNNSNTLSAVSSLSGMAGLAGMAGMNPLAMLQLQSMASMGTMAGMGGLAGLAGMNYGGTTTGTQQTSGIASSDTSAMSGVANVGTNSNPYAAMFGGQNLVGQTFGGQAFGGQSLMMPSTQTTKVDPTKQVFVRNLPWKVTWQELKDKFREAGRVVRADILMDDKQRSKGCGTVLFESTEDAARAISTLNGTVMDGRQIEVRMDRG